MEETKDIIEGAESVVEAVETDETVDAPKGKYGALTSADDGVHRLSGMYKNWFLDYAWSVPCPTWRMASSPCSAVSFTP